METFNTKNHLIGVTAISLVIGLLLAIVAPLSVSAQTAPSPTLPGGPIDQRLAQRKAERNIVLTQADQQRLTSSCVKSQGSLRLILNETTGISESRDKVLQQIDAKLWVMIGRLKLVKKDTFALEKNRSSLAEKAAYFQQTTKLYQQALDDAAVINCQADVVGFKAFLETARIYQLQLREQSIAIRAYVNNDIKTTLGTHVKDLQVKPATDESLKPVESNDTNSTNTQSGN